MHQSFGMKEKLEKAKTQKPVEVVTNFFTVEADDTVVYRYDVCITASKAGTQKKTIDLCRGTEYVFRRDKLCKKNKVKRVLLTFVFCAGWSFRWLFY